MTKWQLDREGGPWDYPTLGFSATDGAIIDGSLSNPVMTTAPDAFWDEYVGGSAETGVTRWGEMVHPPAPAEPTAGSMLVYDATDNRWAPSTATDVFATTEVAAALSATIGAEVEDRTAPAGAAAVSLVAATAAPYSRPSVRNRVKLARFATALRDKATPVITVVGNSITHGVGSDGFTSTTANYHEPYREYAWPVILRKLLAQQGGYLPAENFVHPGSWFGVTQNLVGGATRSGSVSAWGFTGYSGGGLVLNADAAAADFLAARMGKFTEVDVFYWGSASGIGGYSPRILIDDVEASAGRVASAGNLVKTTITGLTDAQHKITVQGSASGCCVAGVVTRRSATGIVVNRVGFPGATAAAIEGDGAFTTAQKNRNRDAAVMAGYSDLVIIAMTANEVYNQHPLAAYQSALQATIDRAVAAGACVLLMADPAVNNEETAYAIKGSQYRATMAALSDANSHVAYADMNAIFGERADAEVRGLFQSGGSVHPLYEGHRRMADFVLRDILPGASVV